MKRAAAAIAVVGLVGAAVVLCRARSSGPPPAPPPAPAESPTPTPPQPQAAAPQPVAAAPSPPVAARRKEGAPPSEPALMASLHEIGATAPELSLNLARDGQRRFPDGTGAAERAFIIVRALVDLQRFHEARAEAREMVRKYPDDPRALDAQRHLLVYPLDQPSREEMQQRDQ